MKYVVYARKSTEDREDRQVISIESQLEAIKSKYDDLTIAEYITESKSAYKAFNRPEFQRMVEMFEKGKVQGLLAWHPDRLSREPISAGMLMHLLDRGRIKDMKFACYNFDNSPEGKMMLSLVLSQSKYFSEKLSVDVKRGMLKKCRMGQRPCRPPIGYKPDRLSGQGEKMALVDRERFTLVRKLWTFFLTGQYSVPELAVLADEWGLVPRPSSRRPSPRLHASSIYKILKNPFYAGAFVWDGQYYKGTYEPMITWEEYEHAQHIFGKRVRFKTGFAETPYSRMFRCSCGEMMYVDSCLKRRAGKPPKHYYYLRCRTQKKGKRLVSCGNKAVSVVSVNKQVRAFLKSIEISPAFDSWIKKNLKMLYGRDVVMREDETKAADAAYRRCIKQIERLTDALISGLIGEEEYKEKKRALFIEKEKKFAAKEALNRSVDSSSETVELIFSYAKQACRIFENGTLKEKQAALAKAGANFVIEGQKVRFEAKKSLLIIQKRLPEVRRLEAVCEPPENGEFKPINSLCERLICRWSGLWYEVRTFV